MARTLTDALNAQPTSVVVLSRSDLTSSSVRDARYDEIYRESTGVREPPIERLQRLTEPNIKQPASSAARGRRS